MEKQADIMKDVLETQSATLDGNNMLAKQALADSMGLQLKDLMYMNEKKHLQEQITESMGDAYDLDTIFADPSKKKAFELELIDKSKSTDPQIKAQAEKTLVALDKLAKSDENRRSPAENIDKRLASMQDQGLNVKIIGGDDLKKARTAAGTFQEKMSATYDITASPTFQQYLGALQESRITTQTLSTGISDLVKIIPGFGGSIAKLVTYIEKTLTNLKGGVDPASIKTESMQTSPTSTGALTATPQDAVIGINDGVIKFNDKDKLTVVASPFGTMNEKVADKITNPKTNNSSGAEITQLTNAINSLLSKQTTPQSMDNKSIVSAIQSALGNINITVALDPMAIDKEIKFRQGSLNS
jgi:hypothetical protein